MLMIIQWVVAFTAFLIILGLTLLTLHLAKYRRKHACACGARKVCDNPESECAHRNDG